MSKYIISYLMASILVILFSGFAYEMMGYLRTFFLYTANGLSPAFSFINASILTRKICILILIPLILTSIPALFYKAIRGKHMPYWIESIWIVWLLFALSYILIR